jgi:hypothetical protein
MKPPKRSTEKIIKQSNDPQWFDYTCTYSFVQKPANEAFIRKLATDLMEWVRTKEAFKVSEFYSDKGISKRDWANWVAKWDFLADAVDAAKIVLGNKREIGGLKKKYDSGMIRASMRFYDEDWKTIDVEEDNKATIVVMEKMPNSDAVPEKKKVSE